MRIGHFTRLKGRTTYFRRKVPLILRSRLASSEICVRLGVVNRDSAERQARRLAVAVDEFFKDAATNTMLAADDLSRLISLTMTSWRQQDERRDAQRALEWGGRSAAARDEAAVLGATAYQVLAAQESGRNMHDDTFVLERLDAAGLPRLDDPVDRHLVGRKLSVALAAHYLTTAIEMADRQGLYRGRHALPVEEWQERLSRLGVQVGTGAAPTQVPEPATGTRQPPPQGRPNEVAVAPEPVAAKFFSELVERSLTDRINAGLIQASARHESGASTRIWMEVCGDRPVDQYARRDMAEFRSVLVRLPKSYWKSEAEQEKTILMVIAEAEAKAPGAYTKVSAVTVNRHLSTIAPILEWCRTSGELPADFEPFWTGFHVPTGRRVSGLRANEERPAYSLDQIRRIFEHPVWTGRKSAYYYTSPGAVIVRDSLYWCPLIAAFHAMRREEFAQLKVKHVRQIDGIWVFDLHHVEVRTKNDASPRFVPVHDDLLMLGLIDDVVLGRDPGTQLFPELRPSASHGKFGDALGKRFGRVIDDLGIVVMRKNSTESDGAFHPFRHRLVTDLTAAGVPLGIIDAITGHRSDARKSERARYTDELYVGVLKEGIDKLKLPIDLEGLNRRWRLSRLGETTAPASTNSSLAPSARPTGQ